MLTDEQMHERMRKGWRLGRPFTPCGTGSLPKATENVRKWLPEVCARRGIRSVCDAGAGDLQWRLDMVWDVAYRAFDLIPRHPDVSQIDITREALPACDAILCRMVLNHLDPERVALALGLFRGSAQYLFATQFDRERVRNPAPSVAWLDLREYLGDPLESADDGGGGGFTLALWQFG